MNVLQSINIQYSTLQYINIYRIERYYYSVNFNKRTILYSKVTGKYYNNHLRYSIVHTYKRERERGGGATNTIHNRQWIKITP